MMNKQTNPNDPVSGAIYARSAILDPASINRQINACHIAAARMNMRVLPEHMYFDAGTSGNTLVGRAGLNKLFEAAKVTPPAFRWVLVEDESRIARNLASATDVIQQFHSLGVTVYFVRSGHDSRDKQFLTSANLLSAFDRCFWESARDRRAGKKAHALQPVVLRHTDPTQGSAEAVLVANLKAIMDDYFKRRIKARSTKKNTKK